MNFRCPTCNSWLKAREDWAGQVVRCPQCRKKCRVPAESPAEQPRQAPSADHDSDSEAPLAKPPMHIDHEDLIDMTAMVDIVFFLLIFFLVTSMAGVYSSARMPRTDSSGGESGGAAQQLDSAPNESSSVIVKINKDDTIEVDGVPFREISDLIVRLRQIRSSSGADIALMIQGHAEATHGAAASVLDAAYEVGFSKLQLSVVQ